MNYLKMKQNVLLFFINLLIINAFGQNMYVSISGGYATKMSQINLMMDSKIDSAGNQTMKYVNGSLGSGFCFNGGFGFMLNKHLGVELNTSYLLGSEIKSVNSSSSPFGTYTAQSLKANMFRFLPSVVFSVGENKIKTYGKVGIVIAKGTIMYAEKYKNMGNNEFSEYNKLLTGDIQAGLQAGLGFTYSLTKSFSLFAELSSINMSYAPTKSKLVKFTSNGVDLLPSLDVFNKESVFVKEIDFATVTDFNQPKKELQLIYPLSSVGLNLGTRFEF